MASDNEYDSFDYNSSQDSSNIDYQIDLFEFRQYVKSRKSRQKKSPYPISIKTLKSHLALVKAHCTSNKITPKAEQKIFRYTRYPQKVKTFECDEQFQIPEKTTTPSKDQKHAQSNVKSSYPKTLEAEHLDNFSKFRCHFYHVYHQSIKSSLTNLPNVGITDIRLAPINERVQKDFMQRLNQNSSSFPQLVYHGTRLTNISSILRYGFLIPNQPHPSNSEAPIIVSAHGRSYGTGVYCSRTADYSVSYMNSTNTLLVCAAIPKRNKLGKFERCHGNILVLSHVSQIIPLFLIDFKYLNYSGINRPWFDEQNELKIDKNKLDDEKSAIISRKYLRKILNYINDEVRKNNQYQIRSFELFI